MKKSLEELNAIRESVSKDIELRIEDGMYTRVRVAMDDCGIEAGAKAIMKQFITEIEKRDLRKVKVYQTRCMGRCDLEPMVEVIVPNSEKAIYVKLKPEDVAKIVEGHIVNGDVVRELAMPDYR